MFSVNDIKLHLGPADVLLQEPRRAEHGVNDIYMCIQIHICIYIYIYIHTYVNTNNANTHMYIQISVNTCKLCNTCN